MEKEIQKILSILENDLAANEIISHPMRRVARNLRISQEAVRTAISLIREDKHFFKEESARINYHKQLLPPIFCKLFYFRQVYDLEMWKLHHSPENFMSYCERELERIMEFFRENSRFCERYFGDVTESDAEIYGGVNSLEPPDFPIPAILNAANVGCLLVSCLLANEAYADLLRKELFIGMPIPAESDENKVQIKMQPVEVVELVIAMLQAKRLTIGGRTATQQEAINWGMKTFGVEIKSWPQVLANICNRKFGDLFLLDELKNAFAQYRDKRG